MNYYVCFQNCIEDYYSENAPSLEFSSFDAAIRYLTSLTSASPLPIPDVEGKLKWYFPSCGPDGLLHDPDPEEDRLELYQIINIIPSCDNHVSISNCYGDDQDAIVSMRMNYMLDYLGHVDDVWLSEIQYVPDDE